MKFPTAILLALAAILLPPIAQAQEARLAGDVFASGASVTLDGEPAADAFAAAENVTILQALDRNAYLAGRRIDLNGPVGGDAFAAGFTVTINGPVEGRAYLAGYEVTISSTSTIGQGARLFGRTLAVNGTIEGDTVLAGETVAIAGTINGDVIVTSEDLIIAPQAVITGNLEFRTEETAAVPPDVVAGSITDAAEVDENADGNPGVVDQLRANSTVQLIAQGASSFFVFGQLVAGLIIFLGFPGLAGRLRTAIEHKSFGNLLSGILALIIIIGAVIVAAVTIIGIPIAILLALTVPFILMLGYAIGAIGWLLIVAQTAGQDLPNTAWIRLLLALVAIIPVYVLGLVPFIGWLVSLATTLLGLGALFAALRKRSETLPA
ncbi:MAG: polymer-forming cytoskeletal protein [Pseudomonadota bacterium]